MKRELLRMEHITKIRETGKVLDDLELNVFKGEILGILGLSGSGKTLITRILSGCDDSFSGTVYFREQPLNDLTSPLSRQGIFCIFSVDGLIPELSVAENIFIMQADGKSYGYVNKKKINRESRHILSVLGLSDINPGIKVKELTRYEQCLIQLARALVAKAELIVMDTIFESFSRDEQLKVEEMIRKLQKTGISFLITSRFCEYLTPVADRIIVLRNGRNIRTFYRGEYIPEQLMQVMLGFHYQKKQNKISECGGEELLRINGLSINRLSRFSMTLREGEIVGLWELRDNWNMLLCSLLLEKRKEEYEGEIFLKGERFYPKHISYAVKKGIGVIWNDALKNGLVPQASAADNILIPAVSKISRFLVRKGLYQYIHTECSAPGEDVRREVTETLDVYRQYRILMEKWTLARPSVFLCVNPCITSDMVGNHIIYHYMEKMAQSGTGILIASSNLSYMTAVCTRIIVFYGDGLWTEFLKNQFETIDIKAFV